MVNWDSAGLYKQFWVNLGSRLSIPKKGVTFKQIDRLTAHDQICIDKF